MSGVDGKPPKLFGPTGVSHIPEESPDGEANSYLLGLRGQLPKQLHAAAKERPGCLRAIAAVAVNTQEAPKFTLGQKVTVLVSHTVSAVLEVKGGHWLSPQRFLKYQAIMVEQDDVEIVVTNIVNPASFLSGSMGEPVIHECLEAIEATCSSCLDLKDTLLENTETWSTDGSSCVISGRHAGYVVTMSREVIESGPLPTNTSAQKAEITARTWALELAKGKKVNIYPDLRQPNQPVQPQAPEGPPVNANTPPIQEEPVAHRTRGEGTGRSDDGDGEAKMEDGLYSLRKVPMANPEQRPIGDVSVPLNTGDVREFKKEMGRLLEDPIGVAERLDQFLGPNIYTWVELQSILGILLPWKKENC
ncbi:hypothetical protein DUI87_28627 [Hirundo rustica rustica]|uniref:RNase H type-1 domain-containing protein n=1 Tax=Hirundo rustica rustica TaxID=333673 RepID=A0A3M0JJJ8_HIRRU|nr:hypothetical protein DUI87_28627 [Hirundo rustica rustica]